MPSVTPALHYRDAPEAIRFLTDVLGFEENFVVPGRDGSILHAELRWRNGFVFVRSAGPDTVAVGGTTVCLVLESGTAVDVHYERAVAGGADIVERLNDTPFGSHQYSARDPEGNVWVFGTYQPTPVPAVSSTP
jgi:uncharacterized glyoxalase superfamily protein PhnB